MQAQQVNINVSEFWDLIKAGLLKGTNNMNGCLFAA